MSSQTKNVDTQDEEKKKKRFKSKEEELRFYLTFVSLTLFFCSFSVFVFLIPFVIDPAVAVLRADFAPEPADCRVLTASYRLGVSLCGWASCREGCTRDIFECHQVRILSKECRLKSKSRWRWSTERGRTMSPTQRDFLSTSVDADILLQ